MQLSDLYLGVYWVSFTHEIYWKGALKQKNPTALCLQHCNNKIIVLQ